MQFSISPLVTSGHNDRAVSPSPDGSAISYDLYVFSSGTEGLISVNWDGSDRRRIGARVNVAHLSITGDRVVYIAKAVWAWFLLTGASTNIQTFRIASESIAGSSLYRNPVKPHA